MKQTYTSPKLQLILLNPTDVLTLSDGGSGSSGMEIGWNTPTL